MTGLLTYAEFVKLVKQMRTTQKEYFKGRQQSVLIESKEAEHRVDEAIKALEGAQSAEQYSLSDLLDGH